MPIWMLIVSIATVVICIAIVVIVLLQSGKQAGISGVISGGADTFLSKNKAKSMDARLARWTKWFAIAFFVFALVLGIASAVLL